LEAINGKSKGIEFDKEEMKSICQRASEVLDVKVYGGDCIVSPEGEIRIIDFNDWPSFAPCRDAAAPHIAKCILSTIKQNAQK
jgi:glutathione synthase/RimK-type ligase-like ATP-grasp enzyme